AARPAQLATFWRGSGERLAVGVCVRTVRPVPSSACFVCRARAAARRRARAIAAHFAQCADRLGLWLWLVSCWTLLDCLRLSCRSAGARLADSLCGAAVPGWPCALHRRGHSARGRVL